MVCKSLCQKSQEIRIDIFVSASIGIRKHWRNKHRNTGNRVGRDKVGLRLFSIYLLYHFHFSTMFYS